MFEGLKVKSRRFAWRSRRFFYNLGYRFKVIRAPSPRAMRPSVTISLLIIMGFAVFNLAGGVYDLLERPVSLLPFGRQYSFIYRGSINIQTLNESLVAGLLYFLGIAGLYMLLRSTRFAYRPRNAYLLLIVGFVISIIWIYYSNFLLTQKIG